MTSLADNLQQQLDELEALQAVYGTEALVLAATEQEAVALARLVVAGEVAEGQLGSSMPSISGILRLPDTMLMGASVGLQFALGPSYPSQSAPQLSVECCAPRHTHERLTDAVKQCASSQADSMECCLLLAAEKLKEEVQLVLLQDADITAAASHTTTSAPATPACTSNGDSASQDGNPGTSGNSTVLRVAIWFHHIKSVQKRKLIVSAARALGVKRACKPGFPGVIVCEGLEADVRSFVSEVRALSWQAMQVRAEELMVQEQQEQHLDGQLHGSNTALPGFQGPFQELPEGGMSELGQLCRDAGAEQLFLAALKLCTVANNTV